MWVVWWSEHVCPHNALASDGLSIIVEQLMGYSASKTEALEHRHSHQKWLLGTGWAAEVHSLVHDFCHHPHTASVDALRKAKNTEQLVGCLVRVVCKNPPSRSVWQPQALM